MTFIQIAPLTNQDASIGSTSTTGTQALATFTASRTGTYHISGWLHSTSGSGSNQWRVDVYVGGAAVRTGPQIYHDGVAGHIRGVQWRGSVTSGQSMQLVSVLLGGTHGSITVTGEFYTTFVPTPTNPK